MKTNNCKRAERFAAVLRKYNDDLDEWNLIDLLADARHWCDRQQLCFGELDRIAYRHYSVERADERGQP